MIVLGLGTNTGDRLDNLRTALKLIRSIPSVKVKQISPVYKSDALLPVNAPTHWDQPYLNAALRCQTTLSPHELLKEIKKIELKIGRLPAEKWAPRIIDIDILAWDDVVQSDSVLTIPHPLLHERPFALFPLIDVAPLWIFPCTPHQNIRVSELKLKWGSTIPFNTHPISQRFDTSQFVGVLNITPDSFSDGGKFSTINDALHKIKSFIDEGASVVDIGAEATGPRSSGISAEEEWNRLEPLLEALSKNRDHFLFPKISLDTRQPIIAEKALKYNVDWINDVSGLDNPFMQKIISNHSCDVVIMHHLGIPPSKNKTLQSHDPSEELFHWAEKKLTQLEDMGIKKERVIMDVGIGYGKTAHQSFSLINDIKRFRELNVRLLVGHSRKSFLEIFNSHLPYERDIETLACSLHLNSQEIDYIRIHNVEMHSRFFKVNSAFA